VTPGPSGGTIPLVLGLQLALTFPAPEALGVELRFRNRTLGRHTFTDGAPTRGARLDLWLLRAGVHLDADLFTGEVTGGFEVAVRRGRRHRWHTLGWRRPTPLVRFDPTVGEMAGRTDAPPPVLDHPTFGACQPCGPTVLRLHVDDDGRDLCPVGRIVKRELFPDDPPFTFNVVACVGAFPAGGPGRYADPLSVWFNIFLGYYQLDCAKSAWDRPFGYKGADGEHSVPEPADLLRLGMADWNWFSNWDYGVPEADLLPYSRADPRSTQVVDHGLITVGASLWHDVEVLGLEVASCYESDGAGAGRLVHNSEATPMFRHSFGGPSPRQGWTTSFVPTTLDARLCMAYWEDDLAYHSLLFGGTVESRTNPLFLAAQVDAVRDLIITDFPTSGFPPPTGGPTGA
jgi:hypothetical protein